MRILGINAPFHDPAAMLGVEGRTVEAAEEQRCSRREHGKRPARGLGPHAFGRHTGLPVVVDTSLNTAGRPMADDPRDALECFGCAPVDLPAIWPYAVHRGRAFA
jgi:predicted NodU family carbamoyl transferase